MEQPPPILEGQASTTSEGEAPATAEGQTPTTGDQAPAAPSHEHLRWLCAKDRRILSRSECAAAVREEGRVINDLHAAIEAHRRAIEHCKAASELDPEWFTLDVQDSSNRRIALFRDALAVLEEDAAPLAVDAATADTVRGALYRTYAHTAQVTVSTAVGISERPEVQQVGQKGQAVALSAFSALASLSTRISTVGASPPTRANGEAGIRLGPDGGDAASSSSMPTPAQTLDSVDNFVMQGNEVESSDPPRRAAGADGDHPPAQDGESGGTGGSKASADGDGGSTDSTALRPAPEGAAGAAESSPGGQSEQGTKEVADPGAAPESTSTTP